MTCFKVPGNFKVQLYPAEVQEVRSGCLPGQSFGGYMGRWNKAKEKHPHPPHVAQATFGDLSPPERGEVGAESILHRFPRKAFITSPRSGEERVAATAALRVFLPFSPASTHEKPLWRR